MPIFVESLIRASIEEVWQATQDPALHQRWDLRFSEIEYLQRTSAEAPQRFLYRTRIGLARRCRCYLARRPGQLVRSCIGGSEVRSWSWTRKREPSGDGSKSTMSAA